MFQNKFKIAGAGLMAALVAVGCTKSSDETTSASDTNVFSSLPEVTGPVLSVASSSVLQGLGKVSAQAATTGVSLSSPGTFASGTSPAMCENINLIKEILREASGPDKILCYMGKMKSSGVIPSSMTIDDGEVKYIKLKNLGEGGSVDPVVRFKIVKTDGAITTFEMASCFGGSSSPVQSEYIKQTFSGTTASVVTKNKGSESTMSYGSSMTTTGEYDNGWVSKNISGFRYYSDSSSSSGNVMTLNLDQFSDIFKMAIAMNGTYSGSTFSNRFFTVAQVLGTEKLATLAIGDGSSKAEMSYTQGSPCSSNCSHTFSNTVSWNGDTKTDLSTASTGDYYTAASAGTVPSAPNSSQTVSFSGDEAWDCTVPDGGSFVEADFSAGGTAIQEGMQSCNDKYIDSNGGGWLQCPYN